jgi:hypothetical protein
MYIKKKKLKYLPKDQKRFTYLSLEKQGYY